jgi:hypothetical protein
LEDYHLEIVLPNQRERFIDVFLSQVFPPPFRFGQGDVTDTAGRRSGQLDVVVEYPLLPSLPVVGNQASSRLYLAEGIAAAIEVKSNVASQWSEVVSTATKLAPLDQTRRCAHRRNSGYRCWRFRAGKDVSDRIVVAVGTRCMSARIGKQVEIDVGRPACIRGQPSLFFRRQLFELTHTDAASFLPDSSSV